MKPWHEFLDANVPNAFRRIMRGEISTDWVGEAQRAYSAGKPHLAEVILKWYVPAEIKKPLQAPPPKSGKQQHYNASRPRKEKRMDVDRNP